MPEVNLLKEDTICAISTPAGEGGIHIVRLSGPRALDVASKVFEFNSKKVNFKTLQPNTIHFGFVLDKKKRIDEAMLSYFKAPASYTREDLIEINLHGNFTLADRVLRLLVDHGARLADKGEFTQRAFLNGRIDLTQAEAVCDLISAKTSLTAEVALDQLQGKLTVEMLDLKQQLMSILAEVEAFVDFPDEDIEVYSNEQIKTTLVEIQSRVDVILKSYQQGEIIREGVQLVIVGKPNVGKSSLLNAFLKRDRAIVSDIAGTTRDSLEEYLDIQGILFRIVDTAGLRDGKDQIESLGIERTKQYIEGADLLVFLLDGSADITEEDRDILKSLSGKKVIPVINKSDLPQKINMSNLGEFENVIHLSALDKTGLEDLEKALVTSVWEGNVSSSGIMLTNQRQFEALSKAQENLSQSLVAFTEKKSLEFLAFDLREALGAIGEVVGEVYSDDILGVIFSKFCLGK